VLLIGFALWIAYGIARRDPALVVPNSADQPHLLVVAGRTQRQTDALGDLADLHPVTGLAVGRRSGDECVIEADCHRSRA